MQATANVCLLFYRVILHADITSQLSGDAGLAHLRSSPDSWARLEAKMLKTCFLSERLRLDATKM